MEQYDVIIIGGGPAGSTLARSLEGERRVLVVDKAEFPRDKTCAGWVTPAVLDELQVDRDDYARGRVLQPIHGFRIGLMGQPPVENDHGGEPVSYGIRRCEFDHYLLSRTGADKALGEKVKDLRRENGQWQINGRWQAPVLVGAGGHFCPVASRLGDGPGSHEAAVTAKEVEFELTEEQARHCPIRDDRPELWFCADLRGYGWVFRKGNWLNVGLGRDDNHHLGDHLDDFVGSLQAEGRLPDPLPARYKGHAYLLYEHARRPLVGDGVLLVGDAAGLAYTQSGEGIRTAVESALLAADTLRDDRPLSEYAGAVEARFGHRGNGRIEESTGPAVAVKKALAAPLMRTHWFTRKIVTERWFLHTHVPALEVAGGKLQEAS